MPHYGLLREYRFDDLGTENDVRGAHVYGLNDEKLGKIDDVIFDHESGKISYAVIESGGWFTGKKFLVPAERLRASTSHPDDFSLNADKKQIEQFPPYEESALGSEDRWRDYEKRFQAAWQDSPVQHRQGSDRDVTPTPEEMPPEPGSMASQLTPSQRAETSARIIPPTANEVTIQSSATGIGSRWLTFEERLRQRRRDLTRNCPTCTVGPASDRAA